MVLNPVLDQISSQVHFQRQLSEEAMRNTRNQIIETVMRVKVPVEPILGQTRLALSDVARLQVGDVVTLDTNSNDPVPVRVGGITRFLAKPGRRGERSSVQVVSVVRE